MTAEAMRAQSVSCRADAEVAWKRARDLATTAAKLEAVADQWTKLADEKAATGASVEATP